MKLSKLQFCNAVNTFREMLEQDNKYRNLLHINPDWAPSEWIDNYYTFLSDLCGLETDIYVGNTFDWFCFETNFGQKDNKIFDGNKTWRIESPEILYDYLMEVELEEY